MGNLCSIEGSTYCIAFAPQGDVNDGDHVVRNVSVGSFDLVPEISTNIAFEFDLENLGQPYEEGAFRDIFNLQSQAAAGILNALMSGSNFNTLDSFAQKIHSLGGCDGPLVAVAKRLFNKTDPNLVGVQTLDALTRGSGRFTNATEVIVGPDSQTGCGKNSMYTVTWSLIRTSWQP